LWCCFRAILYSARRESGRSNVLHAGRSFAVVRTVIKNDDGTHVLEVVSNHAA
jgi:hypothetical protein